MPVTTATTVLMPVDSTTSTALVSVRVPDGSSAALEFYYSGDEPSGIYTSPDGGGELIALLEKGYVITITDIYGNYGMVNIGGKDGWISLDGLVLANDIFDVTAGDVNKDGAVDKYDLSLVNEYIRSLKFLPEGISLLSSTELQAADINSDGVVDKNDVLDYLTLICK